MRNSIVSEYERATTAYSNTAKNETENTARSHNDTRACAMKIHMAAAAMNQCSHSCTAYGAPARANGTWMRCQSSGVPE